MSKAPSQVVLTLLFFAAESDCFCADTGSNSETVKTINNVALNNFENCFDITFYLQVWSCGRSDLNAWTMADCTTTSLGKSWPVSETPGRVFQMLKSTPVKIYLLCLQQEAILFGSGS